MEEINIRPDLESLAEKYGVPSSTARNWWNAGKFEDEAELKKLVKKRSHARETDTFQFTDAKGRKCIALEKVPEEYGICIDTMRKWAKKGCPALNGEKPTIWKEPIKGQAPRTFTFNDFLDRQKKAKLTFKKIRKGWCTLKYAERWKSHGWLLKAVRQNLIPHDEHVYLTPQGQTRTRKIVPIKSVKSPKLPRFKKLLTPAETGINQQSLRYLRKTGKVWTEKRLAEQPGTGKLVKQYHFKPDEIEKHRRRLERKPGNRIYWIDDRDFYPFYEAKRLGTDAKKATLTTFQLRNISPREFGGFHRASDFFDPPRPIECRKVTERGYRSKHGDNLTVFAGDDLREIERRIRGWDHPRAAPPEPTAPKRARIENDLRQIKSGVRHLRRNGHAILEQGKAGFTELSTRATNIEASIGSLKPRPGRPRKLDHAQHIAWVTEWVERHKRGTTLPQFLEEKKIDADRWENEIRTCKTCRGSYPKQLWEN